MSSTSGSSDPYLYPGTAVLKNLRGLIDPRQLEAFEGRNTHRRLAELIEGPFTTGFDVPHLKAIHRYIFQDVFEWAGEFRTVELSKDGHLFARPTFVEPTLEQTLRNLAGEGCLAGLDATSFADRAAFYLSELNAAHPFREGNGRT
ncbi:MAG: Fic/DOC family protein, partial [Blastocatellia bacterium]